MQPGIMQDKNYIKEYENGLWVKKGYVYGNILTEAKRCVFSQMSFGSEQTTKITTHYSNLTRNNAFDINGKHFIIVSILQDDFKRYTEFTCAKADIKTCSYDTFASSRDSLNRPTKTKVTTVVFEGVLAEKYAGYEQNKISKTEEGTFVLIVPKSIMLAMGELIKIGGKFYNVTARHETYEFQNEYELEIKGDA